MHGLQLLTIFGVALAIAAAADAQEIDWKKVDAALGRQRVSPAMCIDTGFLGPICR